jgi:hypothetical protein
MKIARFITLLVCAAVLVAPTLAQEPPKPATILGDIPAGSMGFIVAKSVKGTTDNVDQFLKDIGLSAMLQDKMPKGLLELMKSELQLGEGFDASGGLAMVMLEPTQFKVDLAAMVKAKMENKAITEKLPFVVFIPGKDFDAVFPGLKDAKKEKVGDFTQVQLPVGPMLTTQYKGYVLLSPLDKALTAVTKADKYADSEMTTVQKDAIGRADFAVFMNMKVSGPEINKILDTIEKAAADKGAGAPPMGMNLKGDFKLSKDQLKQITAVTALARVTKTGLVFEELVDYVPDSAMAKEIKQIKITDKSLVGRVPNMSYVMAAGSSGNPAVEGSEMTKLSVKQMADKLVEMSGGKITADQGKKLQDLAEALNQQCQGGQFVLGQAPENSGLFGAAIVIECKDSEKVKSLLADFAKLAQDMIQAAAPDEETKQLTIAYKKDGGGEGIDTLDINHPEMAKMPEEERKMMTSFVGEDKIRVMVSAVDKNTVLLTFGGGKAFFDVATKAAKEGGTLPKDKGLAGVLEQKDLMPKKLFFVMAFNAGNIFEMITKGADLSGMGAMLPPIKITSQTPVTVGMGIYENGQHVVFYVPNDMIKELAGVFMMFAAPRPAGGPGMAPVAPGDL